MCTDHSTSKEACSLITLPPGSYLSTGRAGREGNDCLA